MLPSPEDLADLGIELPDEPSINIRATDRLLSCGGSVFNPIEHMKDYCASDFGDRARLYWGVRESDPKTAIPMVCRSGRWEEYDEDRDVF